MAHRRRDAPIMKGGLVHLRNGMVGEVIGQRDDYQIEVLIDGTRVYVDLDEVKLGSVLDRIAHAVGGPDESK